MTISNTSTGATSAVIWGQTVGTADPTTNNTIKNLNLSGNASTTTFAGVGFGSTTISTATARAPGTTTTGSRTTTSRSSSSASSRSGRRARPRTRAPSSPATRSAAAAPRPSGEPASGSRSTTVRRSPTTPSSTSPRSNSADVFGLALGTQRHHAGRPSRRRTSPTSPSPATSSARVLKTDTFSAAGIALGTPNYGTSRIANNSVYGVNANSTPGDFAGGIVVGSAGTTYATTQIYFNSVSMTGARDATALATTGSYALAIIGANPLADVRDNALYNTQTADERRRGRHGGQLRDRPLVDRPLQLPHLELQRPLHERRVVALLVRRQSSAAPRRRRCRSSTGRRSPPGRRRPATDANSISVDPLFALGDRPPAAARARRCSERVSRSPASRPTSSATRAATRRRSAPTRTSSLPPPPANDDFANADVLTELQAASGTRPGRQHVCDDPDR